MGNSVKVPDGVRRPILFLACSVNQRLPSDPEAMNSGVELAVGTGNSVTVPPVVMRPILLALCLGEPEGAVGAGGDAEGAAGGGGDRVLGEAAGGGDAADLVLAVFGEPEGAVGTGDDVLGRGAGRRSRKLRHDARRRHPPDLARQLREPQVPVRSQRHPLRQRRAPDRILVSICGGGVPPMTSWPSWSVLNSVNQRSLFGSGGDAVGLGGRGGDEELGDDAGGRDASDLVVVELGEPEVAVGARGDAEGARGRGQGELGDRAVGR